MARKYNRFRIFLLMLALGLASVPFVKSLSNEFTLASIKLPEISSDGALIVTSKRMPFAGGGGSGGPSEPQPTINTLGTMVRPHIIENADISQMQLQNADLTKAKIENSDFSNVNFSKANFSKASITYSSFVNANFKNANLRGAMFFGANLTEANVSGAKMIRTNFEHSDFENAILTDTDLTDANLSFAKLTSVKGLTYQQLRKAIINELTILPAQLESKKTTLLKHSRQRMKELKKEMTAEELELFSGEFDFID